MLPHQTWTVNWSIQHEGSREHTCSSVHKDICVLFLHCVSLSERTSSNKCAVCANFIQLKLCFCKCCLSLDWTFQSINVSDACSCQKFSQLACLALTGVPYLISSNLPRANILVRQVSKTL